MQKVGAFEAKTHLAKLLSRVARGERIVIEKHGVPVAVLAPVEAARKRPAGETIARIRKFRSGHRLGSGLSLREMIEDGRR
jgi:prevent-host-death family protein